MEKNTLLAVAPPKNIITHLIIDACFIHNIKIFMNVYKFICN